MIRVVILGGGFAGVSAARAILKNIKRSDVQITLVDKNSYHLFTPSLYEVAASEQPQKNVCIPLHEILKGVEVIKDEVQKIDKSERTIQISDKTLNYDYLIIALGSEPEYHEIPGLQEYSIPFKSLEDAVKIRDLVREKLRNKDMVKILVGGGGASGCEFTAELVSHIKKGIKATLIQKSPQLVKELNMEAAKVAFKRLIDKDVEICFGERIIKVYSDHLETDKGTTYNFDIFVWAGGIKPSSITGKLAVNEYLQVQDDIFAAGDIAFLSSNIPQTVRVAREQGRIAGENVARSISHKPLAKYHFANDIYIVPLVGKYAVVQFNNFFIKGFIGWLIQQFVFLRYLLSILPINKALQRWNRFEENLIR